MKILTIIHSDNTATSIIGSADELSIKIDNLVKNDWSDVFKEEFPHDEVGDEDITQYFTESGQDYYITEYLDTEPHYYNLVSLDGENKSIWMGFGIDNESRFEKAREAINNRYDSDHDTDPHLIVEQEMQDHGFVRLNVKNKNMNINW